MLLLKLCRPYHHCLFSLCRPLSSKPSFYDELGVHPQSTAREIKVAFYQLSKKHHPDTNLENPEALAKFQAIAEAYDILGNPASRTKYDKGVLGRASSVAEREQSTHRFEGEAFYEGRREQSSRLRGEQEQGSKKLDKWVVEKTSDNFGRRRHHLKKRAGVETQKKEFRTQMSNYRTDRNTGSGLTYIVMFLVVIFVIKLFL